MNNLEIIIAGKKQITTKDWQLQIAESKAFWEDLKIEHFKSEKEKNDALNFQKKIGDYRDYIKDTIKQLDDEEILKLRIALNDFDKLLASKNGDIKRAYDKYKIDEKERQIEEGFDLIIEQKNFKADRNVFETDYLEAIKGKGYKDYFEIAQKVAFDYSNMLERNQLKFDKYLLELKNYCLEIGYIVIKDYLERLAKEVVLNGVAIEIQKAKLLKAYEDMNAKIEQANKIAEISVENKKQDEILVPILTNAKNSDFDIDKNIFKLEIVKLKSLRLLTDDAIVFRDCLVKKIEEFLK